MDDTNDAELALAQVAADLIESISLARAAELAAVLPGKPRDWRSLGPRARGMAESAGMPREGATPDRPGEHYCDICGCADQDQIEPGPDAEHFGADKAAWMCKDANARACEARKLHRYPPRPDLVPEAMLSALDADDAAQAARKQAQQQQAVAAQAAARQQWHPPGWQVTENGSYDEFGTWRPNLPPVHPLVPPAPVVHSAYSHTLMNPHNRTHLLSGQQRPHYYGGHSGYIPPGLYGAEGHQEAPQGQPVTSGPGGAQAVPGAVPGQPGGDRPLGQQQGPVPVLPQFQAMLPEHGPKLQPVPRRRGRKALRYSSRKPARKHPGTGGSDSFGNAPPSDGPDGSAASAER
jgi:hypothetical protein